MGACASVPAVDATTTATGAAAGSVPAATTATGAAAGSVPASKALVKLLGDSLISKTGVVRTANALAGKNTVALYFSAHWCPPCRGFTPALSDAYTKHLKAKGVEIVFVSSDRDAGAFKSYYGSMPWLALPYGARDIKQALSTKYRVQGIPTLVLLRADGSLLDANGRALVTSDPRGHKWLPAAAVPTLALPAAAPKSTPAAKALPGGAGGLEELLGAGPSGRSWLVAADGSSTTTIAEVVQGAPLVALYFSAHWCGPCRAFTPKLVTFHEMLAEEGVRLPIIFGSSDRDQPAFDDYFASMPWAAFPHGDSRIEALKSKFGVSGIPWLVVLDAQGNLVVNEADTDVPQGPQAYRKWLALARKQNVAAAPAA